MLEYLLKKTGLFLPGRGRGREGGGGARVKDWGDWFPAIAYVT